MTRARTRKRPPVAAFIAAAFLLLSLPAAALFFFNASPSRCPPRGLALTPGRAALSRLKNRDATPQQTDFDTRVTLAALLEPGDDRARWSESRAARIEGYVVAVREARVESANCFARRDIHIEVAASADAPPPARVVIEVTPRAVDAAGRRGEDWTADALSRSLAGRVCRFEGWLLFDTEHAGESEHHAPGRAVNWRATAWELHPVTRIEVVR